MVWGHVGWFTPGSLHHEALKARSQAHIDTPSSYVRGTLPSRRLCGTACLIQFAG